MSTNTKPPIYTSLDLTIDDVTDCPVLTFDNEACGGARVQVRISDEAAEVLGRVLAAAHPTAVTHIHQGRVSTERVEVTADLSAIRAEIARMKSEAEAAFRAAQAAKIASAVASTAEAVATALAAEEAR